MLISHDRQFLFIHIQKTAGTSITNSLSEYADHPELLWENRLLGLFGINVNHVGPWQRKRFRGHCSAADVKRHLPAAAFDRLFKFAFVRNPWDLLVSLYNYIPTRRTHRYRQRVAEMSFPEFVELWTTFPETCQKARICDGQGTQLVDFVGYYETLTKDYDVVCQRLGIESTLSWDNRTSHNDYRQYYTEDLKQLVNERLAEDLEFFGYDFDGLSSERRLELQSFHRTAA